MNKRGEAITFGILLLIGIAAAGAVSSVKMLGENQFVGYTFIDESGEETKHYYNLAFCIVDISQQNLVGFKNEQEAIDSGFTRGQCGKELFTQKR